MGKMEKTETNEEFMKGIRARLQAAAREAAETERRMEEEAEAAKRIRKKVPIGEVVVPFPDLREREKIRANKQRLAQGLEPVEVARRERESLAFSGGPPARKPLSEYNPLNRGSFDSDSDL
jgi:hypothetical protein